MNQFTRRIHGRHAIAVVLGLCVSGAAALGQIAPQARARVSARKATITFTPDTTHRWGWPVHDDPQAPSPYSWNATLSTVDGYRRIQLVVMPPTTSGRTFPSQTAAVAAGRLSVCDPMSIHVACTRTRVRAVVSDGRVTFVLRDHREIARLFGLRPPTAYLEKWVPESSPLTAPKIARIEYATPSIPAPTDTMRRRAEALVRHQDSTMITVERELRVNQMAVGLEPQHVPVGDSLDISAIEYQRTRYTTSWRETELPEGTWSADDSTVAWIRPRRADSTGRPWPSPGYVRIVGRQPGRTTIRVHELRGPADTIPNHIPFVRSLSLDVIVEPLTRPSAPR